MPKDYGQAVTQLFITSGWPMHGRLINKAYEEFVEAGWQDFRRPRTSFRCLTKFDVDMDTVRRAAKKNPGMIFVCFTVSCETDETVVHLGIGGAWLKTTRELSEAIGLRHGLFNFDYVRTMEREEEERRPARRAKSRGRGTSDSHKTRKNSRSSTATKVSRASKARKARKGPKAKPARPARSEQVVNTLVFHGLPAEVERCRTLAMEMLPADDQARVKYTTAGSEQYLSGTMEFATQGEPALRAFNRLVARVPAVTVVLGYDDVKSGLRRELRAVDGKIV
jgi:hypothetical protein